ncbi:MAG TPA: glycosyltransferase [Puia sp.]|jgi:GT2 family glycosyltransferase|nr:glycosyltransferase [Puia sp.]
MISVIICSKQISVSEKFSSNVQNTIGATYELISIDNSKNQYGICQAYNIGVSKSKYPYLCFVHEDVLFETNNWGKELIDVMKTDDSIGLIGVAGSKAKPKYARNNYDNLNLNRGHLKQGLNSWTEYYDLRFAPAKKDIEDVVWIDGVFMFVRRSVFENCSFDENILKGFHGYDIDLSLQAFSKNWRIIVYENLNLYHYSRGNYSPDFFEASQLISKKWKRILPAITKDSGITKWKLFCSEAKLILKYDQHFIIKALRKVMPFIDK